MTHAECGGHAWPRVGCLLGRFVPGCDESIVRHNLTCKRVQTHVLTLAASADAGSLLADVPDRLRGASTAGKVAGEGDFRLGHQFRES